MPNKGSWDGKWTGETQTFARTRTEKRVPKELWNNSFYHRWDDGWTACVTVTQMPANEARKIMRKSKGFCGYDWMIESIIRFGEIRYAKDW